MKIKTIDLSKRILFTLLLIFSIKILNAQPTGPHVVLEKAADNIYMFSGYWGNVTVLTGDDGLLFVDSKNNILVDTMLTEIRMVCDKPLRYLINTHWHRDHVGGNEKMAGYGAEIIAHENVLRRSSTNQEIKFFDSKYPPLPKAALPVITFTDETNLNFDGESIYIKHMIGHTDGDAVILFNEANVISTGDIYFEGLYPYIGIESGGSIKTMISAAKEILTIIDDNTVIIPGHGPLSNKSMLKEYIAMLEDISGNIGKQIYQGISYQKILASKPTKKYDYIWGKDFLGPDKFVELVYLDLTGQYKSKK